MASRIEDQLREGDPTPVAGGCRNSSRFLRDLPDPGPSLSDDLSDHIATLLALHPDVVVRFRREDLMDLDDATKRMLLDDIKDQLDIRPLRASGSSVSFDRPTDESGAIPR